MSIGLIAGSQMIYPGKRKNEALRTVAAVHEPLLVGNPVDRRFSHLQRRFGIGYWWRNEVHNTVCARINCVVHDKKQQTGEVSWEDHPARKAL